MAKVKVAQGVQCVHDGKVYESGEIADVPEAVAHRWLAERWATEVASERPKSRGAQR